MELKKWIVVNYKFRGVHGWRDCPIEVVDFLKNKHHHEFEMKVKLSVNDSDRELEFITIQLILDGIIHTAFENYNTLENSKAVTSELRKLVSYTDYIPYTANLQNRSCEQICEIVACSLSKMFPDIGNIVVEISEDGHYAGCIDVNNNDEICEE